MLSWNSDFFYGFSEGKFQECFTFHSIVHFKQHHQEGVDSFSHLKDCKCYFSIGLQLETKLLIRLLHQLRLRNWAHQTVQFEEQSHFASVSVWSHRPVDFSSTKDSTAFDAFLRPTFCSGRKKWNFRIWQNDYTFGIFYSWIDFVSDITQNIQLSIWKQCYTKATLPDPLKNKTWSGDNNFSNRFELAYKWKKSASATPAVSIKGCKKNFQ